MTPRVRSTWWLVAVAVVVSVGLYWRTLDGFFLGDDLEAIWRATRFDNEVPSLGYAAHHWRPVVDLTLVSNWAVGGLDPVGYRAFNLLAHLVVSALVGISAMRLTSFVECRPISSADRAAGVVAATLFAVMPSHGEAVVWIVGRGDVLMTLFGLAALLVFVVGQGPGPRRRVGLVSLPLLAVALMAKESAVVVPLLAVVLVAARTLDRSRPRAIRSALWFGIRAAAPMLVLTGVWFAVHWWRVGSVTGGFGLAWDDLAPAELIPHAASLAARSFLPALAGWVWVVVSAGLLIVGVGVVGSLRSETASEEPPPAWSTAAVFGACVGIAVLPVLTLGVSLDTSVGERLVYLPSVFAVLAVVRVWSALWQRAPVRASWLAAGLITVASVVTWLGVGHWVRAADEAEALVEALGDLRVDEPALVYGASQRTPQGVPVAVNSVGAAVVLFHGWSDPSRVADVDGPLPERGTSDWSVWWFDGRDLQLVEPVS